MVHNRSKSIRKRKSRIKSRSTRKKRKSKRTRKKRKSNQRRRKRFNAGGGGRKKVTFSPEALAYKEDCIRPKLRPRWDDYIYGSRNLVGNGATPYAGCPSTHPWLKRVKGHYCCINDEAEFPSIEEMASFINHINKHSERFTILDIDTLEKGGIVRGEYRRKYVNLLKTQKDIYKLKAWQEAKYGFIELKIQFLNGKFFNILINKSNTVAQLKQQIAANMGNNILPQKLRIIFSGIELIDLEKKLTDYGIGTAGGEDVYNDDLYKKKNKVLFQRVEEMARRAVPSTLFVVVKK